MEYYKRLTFDFNHKIELFDYIKGMAILFVIMTHNISEEIRSTLLFCLWGQLAVPLFLLITTALFFRNGFPLYYSYTTHVKKLWKRALKPYLIFVLIIALISLLTKTETFDSALEKIFRNGGFGPGNYYIPMFACYSLILPISSFFLESQKKQTIGIVLIIVISMLSINYLPFFIYRILPIRYLMLIPLGYIWATKGVNLNCKTISLSLLSVVSLLVFHYSSIDFSPIFYTILPWDYANWICYFWPAFTLPFIFNYFYSISSCYFNRLICYLGKRSLQILFTQMAVFYYVEKGMLQFMSHNQLLFIIISTFLSIAPIVTYDTARTLFYENNREDLWK